MLGRPVHDKARAEVGLRPAPNPKGDLTLGVPKLEVIHDETRLRRPVDVEGSLQPVDDDLKGRPCSWDKVNIGLIDTRSFVSESKPRVVGMRHVLGRVVATELIIGAAVGRTQEESLEL